jgi:hypothetical protein
MKNYYAKLEGHKVVPVESLVEIATWFENPESRRVAFDKVVDGKTLDTAEVSTVFLAINHGWHERDLWFETMVFGGRLSDEQVRYETWDEAEAGHKEMVLRVRGDGE